MSSSPDVIFLALFGGIALVFVLIILVVVLGARNARRRDSTHRGGPGPRGGGADREGPGPA